MIIRNRFKKQGPRIVDQLTFRDFEALILENDWLRILLLPEKGSDIIEFIYKPLDMDFLWRAPSGFWSLEKLIPGDLTTRSSFIDYYPGGWQEILPNGGPPSQSLGAFFPEHGETPLMPWRWEITADEPDQVAITLQVRLLRVPLLIQKTLLLGKEPILYIDEMVQNLGTEDLPVMWGHHPALGAPFLDENCVIDLPATTAMSHPTQRFACQRLSYDQRFIWPVADCGKLGKVDFSRVLPPDTRKADLFYLTDIKEGWCAVTNQKLSVSFGLAWTPEVFKHIWVWHDANGTQGYPWYGQGYVLAVEPWSSYPSSGLQEATERGTQLTIPGGGKVSARLTAVVGTGFQRVKSINLEGEIIGG